MAKFDYKKWVTENKYGKLNEQAGSALVNIRNCGGSSTYTACLPNASNYALGHQFKYSSPLGTRTGFLQSIVQQDCGNVNNINIIEDPYVGACANNNITPDVPDTGGPTPTGSVDTSDPTPTGSVDTEIMCVGCEMVPNTNGLTLPKYNYEIQDFEPYTPQFVASGEVSTVAYSSLDYQVNGGNGPSPSGYCGTMNPFSPFSVVGSNDFADNVESICAASGSMYDSPEEPIEEPTGSFGTTGNYTVFDYPSGWEVTQWTVEFVEMILDHPNPCNFLQGRVNNFLNQLQGDIGPLQQNLLMQKLAVCQELFILTGCNNLQEQRKKYKLDPEAADVLKKMASRLKGLSSKGKRKKRRNEDQISKLKNIIRETILELQEAELGATGGGKSYCVPETDSVYIEDCGSCDGKDSEGNPNKCNDGCICMSGKTNYPTKGIRGRRLRKETKGCTNCNK